MIPVTIKGVSITDIGFVIFLKNQNDERVLPIFIGPVEAQAISMVQMKDKPKRPMTHDLFKNVLEQTEYRILKVDITEIRDETYYANLYLQKEKYFQKGNDKSTLVIDSRPSDAIALALRFDSPIFVAEHLMEEYGIIIVDKEKKTNDNQPTQVEGAITKKINEQLGIYQKMLDQSIKEERFEDASRLKDQIDILMGKHN